MATAFEKRMMAYAKIKQFPIDENLMPLADPEATEEQTDFPPWASRYANTQGQCRQWMHRQKAHTATSAGKANTDLDVSFRPVLAFR